MLYGNAITRHAIKVLSGGLCASLLAAATVGVNAQGNLVPPSNIAFKLFTPEATLFDDNSQQIITHFFSVNPDKDDNGAVRATWESSHDSSRVWAAATGHVNVRQDS